jgi:hypothetical protein
MEKGILKLILLDVKKIIHFFQLNEKRCWRNQYKTFKMDFPLCSTLDNTLFSHGACSRQGIRAYGMAGKSGNEHFHTTRIAWHKIKIELQNSAVFHHFPYFSHIKCFIDLKAKARGEMESEKCCKVL